MSLNIKLLFKPDYVNHEGVPRINIYLLRLLYTLIVVFVGKSSWSYLLGHQGQFNPVEAVAWSVWAAFSVLALIGIFRPLRMLPIILLEIVYKLIWLCVVAYPLWQSNQLVGSNAEGLTYVFLWVPLALLAMPWKYAFENYIFNFKKK